MLSRTVILHHPQSEGAAVFARQLAEELARRGVTGEVSQVWDESAGARVENAGLVVCIGGDGTVLRAARLVVPHGIPILGVNMGRLGFLTDLTPAELFMAIERLVAGEWRVEERLMVAATLHDGKPDRVFHGLNDVVVSRQSPGRPIYVDVRIDDVRVGVYRCDGIIVATPTGSTGYSLSAGGPILAPTEHHLVLTPVAAHLALGRSLVLQPETSVDLRVTTDHSAVLSVDGQEDVAVSSGARVVIRVSEHTTRFARFREPASFYAELAQKLEHQTTSLTSQRD
jgi:NAD+ kinase